MLIATPTPTAPDPGAVDTVLITYDNPDQDHLPSNPFQFTGVGNLTWTGCS